MDYFSQEKAQSMCFFIFLFYFMRDFMQGLRQAGEAGFTAYWCLVLFSFSLIQSQLS